MLERSFFRGGGGVDLGFFVEVLVVDFTATADFFVLLNAFFDDAFDALKVFWEVFFGLETHVGFAGLSGSVHFVSVLFGDC